MPVHRLHLLEESRSVLAAEPECIHNAFGETTLTKSDDGV